jgi:hypothetical protein
MTNSIGSLLALAATASIALANGGGGDEKKANPYKSPETKFTPGQGIVLADTDEFGFRLSNQLQVLFEFEALDIGDDIANFDVPRARTTFEGHVFSRDIMYLLRLDATDDGIGGIINDGPIKDAWAHWNFSKGEGSTIGLRVGQGRTYHGLEATSSEEGFYFVDRSLTSNTFASVRSRGAWVHGSHNENKLRWCAGVQNGDVAAGATGIAEVGEETSNADNELTYVGSISFDPMGDMTYGKNNEAIRQGDLNYDIKELMGTVGAGIMLGNNTGVAGDVEAMSVNLNTAWCFGDGITAQGEVFIREDDPTVGATEDTMGFYVLGTYTLPKSGDSPVQWGFGLRLNMIDTDDTAVFLGGTAGEITEITAVADAFYHGHACKTQIELTLQDADPDGAASQTNQIFRVQFQLLF